MEITTQTTTKSSNRNVGFKGPRKSFIYQTPYKDDGLDDEDEDENQENSSSKNETIHYSNSLKRLDSLELRKMLSDATGHNLKYESIDLKSNGIKDKGCIALAEYLKQSNHPDRSQNSSCLSRLRLLNLGLNGITDDGFKMICESLSSSKIERLSLWGNDLTDISLELFFNTCLLNSKKLEVIDFGLNRFTSKGIIIIHKYKK